MGIQCFKIFSGFRVKHGMTKRKTSPSPNRLSDNSILYPSLDGRDKGRVKNTLYINKIAPSPLPSPERGEGFFERVFAAIPAIYSGVKANYTINIFRTDEEPRCLQRGSSIVGQPANRRGIEVRLWIPNVFQPHLLNGWVLKLLDYL